MKFISTLALAASLTIPSVALAQKSEDVMSSATFSGMKVRNVGPAYMSGRIADIAVDPNDVGTWYVAVASGGVWKTENAGTTWTPLFDKQKVYSIGDVTLDPSNSDIVWVGTGENNGGRHIAFGDGVYKSVDGGKTWKNMGLENSEHIGDIIVHPTDSNTVWVSAQGPLWSSGGQRGLYKTTDGGETWRNVMEKLVDEWTGVGSLAIDPENPDRLYAFTWSRHRTIAALMDGGPGSALYTSEDGGETWTKLSTGLPKGQNWGKSSVAVSPMKPNVVYATIELEQRTGGFYRSEDYGKSWTRVSDMVGGGTGPHYYQEIFVDPHTFDMVYMSNNTSSVSYDGGKTWERQNLTARHVDDHAFAFHPSDPDFILVGSDGGVYASRDDMKNWRFIANLSLAQFYKVAADDAFPFYNVYGGAQDNSTQGGPSRTDRANGIANSDWFLTMGADGHQPATEPGNPNIVYSQMQQGGLVRHDRTNKEIVHIQPQPRPGEPAERFNWDAPINVSKHDPKRIYHASQRVWRSDDRGDSWTPISGDLTRDGDRMQYEIQGRKWSREANWDLLAMSNFHTIANFSESAVDENVLWAGTDDGLIQVTTDGGENWKEIEIGKLRGVKIPANAYVNDIRADRFDREKVYVALDNHKEGDYKPYLIMSDDLGRTWKSLADGLPEKHLVWRITQDHVNKDLMFLGTEFGLFFTVDGGDKWVELNSGVPTISFRDVRIQRRENDLVAGSFGRGIFILDDYSPLRGLNSESMKSDALLFPSRRAWSYRQDSLHTDSNGADHWTAPNPDFGAVFTYYLKEGFTTAQQRRAKADKAAGKDVSFPSWDTLQAESNELKPSVFLTIKDSQGNFVDTVSATNRKGVQRVAWDLQYASKAAVTGRRGGRSFFGGGGAMVPPGTYTATLMVRENGVSRALTDAVSFEVELLRKGTLQTASAADVAAFQQRVAEVSTEIAATNMTLRDLTSRVALYRTALDRATGDRGDLEARINAFTAELQAVDEELNGQSVRNGMGATPVSISGRLGLVSWGSSSSYGPTKQHREQFQFAIDGFSTVKEKVKNFSNNTAPAIEAALKAAGAPWVAGTDLR